MVSFIEPGPAGSTAAPGVYVAGNVSNAAAQVIVAAAEGTAAGMKINADLIEEETAWAVQGRDGSSRDRPCSRGSPPRPDVLTVRCARHAASKADASEK